MYPAVYSRLKLEPGDIYCMRSTDIKLHPLSANALAAMEAATVFMATLQSREVIARPVATDSISDSGETENSQRIAC